MTPAALRRRSFFVAVGILLSVPLACGKSGGLPVEDQDGGAAQAGATGAGGGAAGTPGGSTAVGGMSGRAGAGGAASTGGGGPGGGGGSAAGGSSAGGTAGGRGGAPGLDAGAQMPPTAGCQAGTMCMAGCTQACIVDRRPGTAACSCTGGRLVCATCSAPDAGGADALNVPACIRSQGNMSCPAAATYCQVPGPDGGRPGLCVCPTAGNQGWECDQ